MKGWIFKFLSKLSQQKGGMHQPVKEGFTKVERDAIFAIGILERMKNAGILNSCYELDDDGEREFLHMEAEGYEMCFREFLCHCIYMTDMDYELAARISIKAKDAGYVK